MLSYPLWDTQLRKVSSCTSFRKASMTAGLLKCRAVSWPEVLRISHIFTIACTKYPDIPSHKHIPWESSSMSNTLCAISWHTRCLCMLWWCSKIRTVGNHVFLRCILRYTLRYRAPSYVCKTASGKTPLQHHLRLS